MTSGSCKNQWAMLCVLTMPSLALCATPEIGTLMQKLARPAPATIAFAEVRFSPLLKTPLRIAGELGYNGPNELERRVTRPFREDTIIRGEAVRVVREDQPPRTFALQRAPELHALLAGFTALLSGDKTAVEREFKIAVSGTDSAWTLMLEPSDARAQKRLHSITIQGHDDQSRCFSVTMAKGSDSVMLLGAAAAAEIPADVTRAWLADYCAQPH